MNPILLLNEFRSTMEYMNQKKSYLHNITYTIGLSDRQIVTTIPHTSFKENLFFLNSSPQIFNKSSGGIE